MLRGYSNRLSQFFYVALTLVFSKTILIIIAWFLSGEAYHHFNRVYYSASTLTLIATLGFDFAVKRTGTRNILVYAAVLVNILIAFAFLYIGGFRFAAVPEIINAIILSFFLCITGIYTFIILYSGDYKKYFHLTLFLFILQVISLVISYLFNIRFIYLFTLDIFAWFIAGYKFYFKGDKGSESLKTLYRQGVSIFVINSSAGLALIADKFFVNHYFLPEIANAYTFAWGVTAPIFYFGNVIERYIYSMENHPPIRPLVIKTGLLQLIATAGYTLLIIAAINFFPNLVPDSISVDWLRRIVPVMLVGYSIYTIMHFPLNGVLLKFTNTRAQEKTAIYFIAPIVIFFVIFLISLNRFTVIPFYYVLLFVWVYLFILTFIKLNILSRSIERA